MNCWQNPKYCLKEICSSYNTEYASPSDINNDNTKKAIPSNAYTATACKISACISDPTKCNRDVCKIVGSNTPFLWTGYTDHNVGSKWPLPT